MNYDSIKTVSDAENATEELREKAEIEAKNIIASARTSGEAKVQHAREKAKAEVVELLANAEKNAKLSASKIEEDGKEEILSLDSSVSPKIEKAISIVLERIEKN